MQVKVNTTANDIRLGKAGEPQKCPFARALKRAVRKLGWKSVSVGSSTANLYASEVDHDKGGPYPPSFVLNLNQDENVSNYDSIVYKFIRQYDTLGSGKPFTITLEIPYPADAEMR